LNDYKAKAILRSKQEQLVETQLAATASFMEVVEYVKSEFFARNNTFQHEESA